MVKEVIIRKSKQKSSNKQMRKWKGHLIKELLTVLLVDKSDVLLEALSSNGLLRPILYSSHAAIDTKCNSQLNWGFVLKGLGNNIYSGGKLFLLIANVNNYCT